jgi:YidC/Oxa1 family membrane protein insertase
MGGGNSRNFIIAILLSVAVLVLWQYFFAQPQIEAQQQAQEQAAAEGLAVEDIPQPVVGEDIPQPVQAAADGLAAAAFATREEAIAAGVRARIETPSVTGSVNLVGGRIDDLRLIRYRATVEDDSPTIVLMSPDTGPDGYFAEFGWVSSDADVPGPRTLWTAPDGAVLTPSSPLVLTYDNGAGLTFVRTIAVDNDYMFSVTDEVANEGTSPVRITPYGRITRLGEPLSTGFFILHEGMIGFLADDGLKQVDYAALEDGPEVYDATGRGWLGITDKYWAATLIPDQGQQFVGRFSRFTDGGLRYQADYSGTSTTLAAGDRIETTSRLFAGAKEVAIVDGYDEALDIERFDLLIDWGWFYFITKPMFTLIDWFYGVVGNFGIAILLATLVIKLVFFPLANRSYRSMAKMRKVMPQVTALRERYKDDRAKQQQAMLEIYRKEKINPVAGCWPILIQIPVFFALYKVLFVTIEMRHAPFFGWIQDLSAPDPTSFINLFGLLPFDSPAFLTIGVWPLLMGVTMWVQMKLTPQQPGAPTFIFNLLPIVFTFMLASFPAGLVIYWAWNNLLSVLQQSFIMRRHGVKIDLISNIRDTFKRKPKKA